MFAQQYVQEFSNLRKTNNFQMLINWLLKYIEIT